MYFWLNIDFPTGNARLHSNSCRHSESVNPTTLKGVGKLKRDGGWLVFEAESDAGEHLDNLGRAVTLVKCDEC